MIYFLHIPKTGGTSTSDFLVRLMPTNSLIVGPGLLDDLLRPENQNWKSADLLMGHFGQVPVPFAEHIITVLREPQSHIYSWYRHVLRSPGHYFYEIVNRESLSFLDWLQDERFFEIVNNPQARNLGLRNELSVAEFSNQDPTYHQREHELRPREVNDWDLLTSALEILQKCSAVGVTDDLESFAQRVAVVAGGDKTFEVVRLNEDEPNRPDITPEEAQAITINTHLDHTLYDVAKQLAAGARVETDLATIIEQRDDLRHILNRTRGASTWKPHCR